MTEASWSFTCIIFPVLIGLLYSMVKTVDWDFFLMWLIGLIREQWTLNEILLMPFFPYKTASRTRISSESVSVFPYSLQIHSAWALCGQSASFLHQDLREVQEEHWRKCGALRAFWRRRVGTPPLTTMLCSVLGHAPLLGGRQLPNQVW